LDEEEMWDEIFITLGKEKQDFKSLLVTTISSMILLIQTPTRHADGRQDLEQVNQQIRLKLYYPVQRISI
jgi:hypothetical protein